MPPSDPAYTTHGQPGVTILLAVYNGAENLQAQLDSIRDQDHDRWHLITSDDGSDDDSPAILKDFAADLVRQTGVAAARRQMTNVQGPGQGGTANFMSLLRHIAGQPDQDSWLAFADQDDIWLPDRLSRGIAQLQEVDAQGPALYCSRTWITPHDLSTRRLSAPRPHPPGFRNALVQNIASGNTILLNPAATRLVVQAAQKVDKVVVHDWWIYQLITGAGGKIVHDDEPTLLYRQHAVNQIGANDTVAARLKRIRQLLRGDFRDWNTTNIAALQCSQDVLTKPNQALLNDFARLQTLGLIPRLRLLRQMGLYRQSTASNIALWLAAILRRL